MNRKLRMLSLGLLFLGTLAQAQSPYAVAGERLYRTAPDLAAGLLEDGDRLGSAMVDMGTFPGVSGGPILVTGLRGRDATVLGYENSGAAAISRRNANGTLTRLDILDASNISQLRTDHSFGSALAKLDDLDGDGLPELLVGAPFDSLPGQADVGAVYVVFLDSNAQLRSHVRITNGFGGLPAGTIESFSRFGSGVTAIGDLDGDGLTEILVGAPEDNAAGISTGGACYVLFLQPDGNVREFRKIDASLPVLAGRIAPDDQFGFSTANLGFLGGAGGGTVAVGAYGADGTGRVHLLRFTPTGFVNLNVEIGVASPAFAAELDPDDAFGFALANIGDLNGDGRNELVVAAPGDDDNNDGIDNKGAVYILYLDEFGVPLYRDKLSETNGNFGGRIQAADFFGSAVAAAGDLNSDGLPDMLIGARNATRSSLNSGSFHYVLNLYCRQPTNLLSSFPSPGVVSFTWDEMPRAGAYLLQGRVSGTLDWLSYESGNNIVSLDTLEPGETYDWRVFSGCGLIQSFASAPALVNMPLLRESPTMTVLDGRMLMLPANFQLGDAMRCWSMDGRLLGIAYPNAAAGQAWFIPPAWWQGAGMRWVQHNQGAAVHLTPRP